MFFFQENTIPPSHVHSPGSTGTQVNAGEGEASPDSSFDENRGVLIGIWTIKAGAPVPPNSHSLILALQPHTEVNESRRVHKGFSSVRCIFTQRTRAPKYFLHGWNGQQHHLHKQKIVRHSTKSYRINLKELHLRLL